MKSESGADGKRRSLFAELRTPHARNLSAARRAGARGGQIVAADEIAIALDDHVSTLGAMRMFESANTSRKIAGVDVAQACRLCDCGRSQQHRCGRVGGIRHLVVGMKCRHMPWHV